ncbi:MAG: bicyclomycin resistance protein [SAR324 cluster bacterium]|uniref:Bicyclomycin resistance protein n=1 Tax=SAR324 cluster bacterium TaxID=2024889 RepID=A0A2D6YJZ7_9DELT|nr:bicyclomycin resistance protein [SAR324 cluster bacterium]
MKTWIRRGSQSAFAILAGTLLISGEAFAQSLRFWTTEEQPDRLAKQEQMAADFKSKTGISVEVIPISESDLGTRATAAFAAGDLPDVIYHTLQYALPWAESGLLDTEAATEVIYGLRASTFSPGALDMAAVRGGYASVPVDGWTQMVVYRKDLFEAHGLNPPNSYANIEAALQKLHNPPSMYGFVAPNKIDENFMSQVLEHVFLANGVSPVDDQGLQKLDEKSTIEVLNFYKKIQDASPEGELFWQQSRAMYFAGEAAMIIWSPFILDELAGLRDSAPPTINSDPTSRELASKTGIITTLAGPSNSEGAAWADVRYFGITADADTDNAMEFVRFSMTDGYVRTLSIAPEGKFPVRRGDAKNPEIYLDAWSKLPVGVDRKAPLADLYPAKVISSIAAGLETASRWGVREGQLALASKIINTKVLNRLVREFIDEERSATATVQLMNQELAKVN